MPVADGTDYGDTGEPGEGVECAYKNDNNRLATSGRTEPTEGTSMTGELMAAMTTVNVPSRGQQRQASDKEVRGGNT